MLSSIPSQFIPVTKPEGWPLIATARIDQQAKRSIRWSSALTNRLLHLFGLLEPTSLNQALVVLLDDKKRIAAEMAAYCREEAVREYQKEQADLVDRIWEEKP
jgi:hypothetical protein